MTFEQCLLLDIGVVPLVVDRMSTHTWNMTNMVSCSVKMAYCKVLILLLS